MIRALVDSRRLPVQPPSSMDTPHQQPLKSPFAKGVARERRGMLPLPSRFLTIAYKTHVSPKLSFDRSSASTEAWLPPAALYPTAEIARVQLLTGRNCPVTES